MSRLALAPEEITAAYRAELGDAVLDTFTLHDQATVVVEREAWVRAFGFAKESADLACNFLSFVSAIDWVELETDAGVPERDKPQDEPGEQDEHGEQFFRLPAMPTYQIVGHVSSTQLSHGVTIKANCSKERSSIETLTGVYGGADWHEREMMEMFGIDVIGHPNKAKLYLPEEFEGFPLRKDYMLGAREVKPWPGHVDVEDMPEDAPVKDDAGNVLEEYSQPPSEDGGEQG